MALTIGEQIGDYEVTGSLGAGGIGEVYKVRHLISHRIEALKVLRPQQLGSVEPVERFMREIRVLASLSHSNIAALHTAFHNGDDLVMVMEFVQGETLSGRLRSVGISMGQSVDYMRQVLSALMYAHEQGVTHRDIKPSNIMVDSHDRVKLLDFGLAITGHDAALTMAGFVLGSLHYMSPEQINGKKVDGRSDLYSLGATFYELLTGKAPIQGDTSYAIMAGHLHAQPVKPTEINPEIPDGLSHVVIKALAKNPDDRYQNAREFLQALETTSQEKTELLRLTQVYHISPDGGSGSAASAPVADTPPSRTTVPIPRPSAPRPTAHVQATHSQSMQAQVPASASAPSMASQVAPQRVTVATSAPVADKTPSSHTPAVLEKIAKELAVYIGPIAKIVVQKTAGRCATVDELYKALAEEIDSSKDREKFMSTRRTIRG